MQSTQTKSAGVDPATPRRLPRPQNEHTWRALVQARRSGAAARPLARRAYQHRCLRRRPRFAPHCGVARRRRAHPVPRQRSAAKVRGGVRHGDPDGGMDGTRRRMTVALPLRRPRDATIVRHWNSFALGVPRRRSLTTTPPRQPPGVVYLYCMGWSLDAYRARTASKCGSVCVTGPQPSVHPL